MSFKDWVHWNLVAFDQQMNTIFGGMPDETISARTYRHRDKYWYYKWFAIFLDYTLTPIAHNHCKLAYESEINRKQYPSAYGKFVPLEPKPDEMMKPEETKPEDDLQAK